MTPEQQAKLISKTNYGKAAKLTTPVVQEITKQFAHRAPEFIARPLHETCDIVYNEMYNQMMKAVAHFKDPSDAFEALTTIAARWGTEHVMQGIEMSKQMQEYVKTINTGTGKLPKEGGI